MKKDPTSGTKSDAPALALEQTPKGSRSMWELLLQLRVLLPYLARVVPLLEPLLDRATSKPLVFDEISQSITAIQTGSRDLEVQARNQALQLERIENQLSALRLASEASAQQTSALTAQLHTLSRSLVILACSIVILLLGIAGMMAFLLAHTG